MVFQECGTSSVFARLTSSDRKNWFSRNLTLTSLIATSSSSEGSVGGALGQLEIERYWRLETGLGAAYDSDVTTNAQKLFEQALTLAANDRAELVAQLLASLDQTESDVEAAWAAEIERRAADARRNPDDDEDWRTVLAEIQREVLSR